MASILKIGQINMYAGNKTPERAIEIMTNHKPHSIGINEGYPFIDQLHHVEGYNLFYGQHSKDQRRGAKDTPILVKNSLTSLGEMAIFGCEKSTPIRIAPERWITVRKFKWFDQKIAHINIHPHAAVAGLGMEVDRVKKYDTFMKTLRPLIKHLKDLAFHVIVSGDVNLDVHDKTGALSPYTVFRQMKMKFDSTHLDAVAWTHGLHLVKVIEIPESATGSDHPARMNHFRKAD